MQANLNKRFNFSSFFSVILLVMESRPKQGGNSTQNTTKHPFDVPIAATQCVKPGV